MGKIRQEEEKVRGNTEEEKDGVELGRETKCVSCKKAKHKTQEEGGGKMRDRCREWEAWRVPECVCLSLSC